jgi:hypothetical protein
VTLASGDEQLGLLYPPMGSAAGDYYYRQAATK